MTEALFIIGVFVFFISVYGAVMLGGHLLAELDGDLEGNTGRRANSPETVPVSASSSTA